MRIAESTAPIRLCARGPSGTFTASTPASLELARRVQHLGGVHALGRHDLHRPEELPGRELPAPRRALGQRHGVHAGGGRGARPRPRARPGAARRWRRTSRSRGCGPASCRSSRPRTARRPRPGALAYVADVLGGREVDACGRRSRAAGRRWAAPRAAARSPWRSARSTSSTPCGPTEQFTPITSAPNSSSARAKVSGDGAVRREPVLLDGHLRDDRQVAERRAPRAAPRGSPRRRRRSRG